MNKEMQRYMYHLVMFDLPTVTKNDRSEAAKFRNFLLREGYIMMQFSIYGIFYKGSDYKEKLEKKINVNLPKKGSVRTLAITEMQFKNMNILISSKKTKQEHVMQKQYSLML